MRAFATFTAVTSLALGSVHGIGVVESSQPRAVAPDTPTVVSDPAGGAWVTASAANGVGVYHVGLSGSLSSAIALAPALIDQPFTLTPLSNGGLLATFTRHVRDAPMSGLRCCARVVALQRRADGTWTAPQILSRGGYQGYPIAEIQSGNRVVLVWARGDQIQAASAPLGGSFGPATQLFQLSGRPAATGLFVVSAGLLSNGAVQVFALAGFQAAYRAVRFDVDADARLQGPTQAVPAGTISSLDVGVAIAPDGTDEIVDDPGNGLRLHEWPVGPRQLGAVRVLSSVDSQYFQVQQSSDGWTQVLSEQFTRDSAGGVGAQLVTLNPTGRVTSATTLIPTTSDQDVGQLGLADAIRPGGQSIALATLDNDLSNATGPLQAWTTTLGHPGVYAAVLGPPTNYNDMSVAAISGNSSYEVVWLSALGQDEAAEITQR